MYYVIRDKKGYTRITASLDNVLDYLLIGYQFIGFSDTMVDAVKLKKGEV